MARNKHPEETIKKILDAAQRLFTQKGYENTSIQDIIDQLGGLSKGAIYHHFRSKEEIFDAVCQRIGEANLAIFTAIRDDPTRSGREKLRAMLAAACHNPGDEAVAAMMLETVRDPRFVITQLDEVFSLVAPHFIQPAIEEGLRDGSLPDAVQPRELAEVFAVLLNVWANPFVRPDEPERLRARVQLLARMLRSAGLDIIDRELEEDYVALTTLFHGPKDSAREPG